MPYTDFVPDKEGNGFSSQTYPKRTNGAMPYYFVRSLLLCLFGGQWWGGFGLPVALDTGLLTLPFAAHPV
ncbi:hypothetical protein [Glaciimonas sp. PAMC28666]|uniref:hypothetical protein n=1 Tax=Glaciimonas sp. PAMC28666 TaxID=2807626 RepID=UPI001964AC62|nr:hypothetical protein [Glaciimonas sp. PAMC28666]QRX84380.1 hypothetical protein JQN73_09475 [Glaciimonas sp. PAMC28666]